MKIGTDIDMPTNIKEGYTIMEYKKRELFTKGVLNPDITCRFYKHYPDYILKEIYGSENPIGEGVFRIYEDNNYYANMLWELYEPMKDKIDKFVGREENLVFPTDEYDMLTMYDELSAYGVIN